LAIEDGHPVPTLGERVSGSHSCNSGADYCYMLHFVPLQSDPERLDQAAG